MAYNAPMVSKRPILFLFMVSIAGLGLGQSVLKTYYAEDLMRVPGLIEVSPGFTTVMDFWDTVSTLASAKGELLRVESAGPRILLSATQKAGQTDLVVEVAGRTLLFVIKIGPGVGPRRYVIELSRTRRPQAGTVPPSDGTQASASTAAPYVPPASSLPPNPEPQAGGRAPAPPVNPELVRFTTAAQVPSDGKGTVTVFFTLENRGNRTIAADPGRLTVTQGGNRLPYSLKREPLRTLINPGEALSGLITLEGVRPGEIQLEWALVEIGTGRQLLLRRSVMAGTRIEIEER